MFEKIIPKPYKCYGTRWIYRNYGVFMLHLESLAQSNSQSLKRAELEGYAKKWMNA